MASLGRKEPEKVVHKGCRGIMGAKADKLKLSLCPSPEVITINARKGSSGGVPTLSPSIQNFGLQIGCGCQKGRIMVRTMKLRLLQGKVMDVCMLIELQKRIARVGL